MHTDETKRKISESVKRNPSGFVLDRSKSGKGGRPPHPRHTIICQECSTQFDVSSGDKRAMARKYCSVECSHKNNYHPNSNKIKRSVYNGQQMDSGAERIFAELLDANNINWIKNTTKSFRFVDSNGKERMYYPDFYLPDFDHWVEIKGRKYIREDDALRLKAVGNNIELMFSHQIKLPNIIHNKDGNRLEEFSFPVKKEKVITQYNISTRKIWIIDGVQYETLRHASSETGIPQQTISTHTKNGIFDVDTYRKNCLRQGKIPKV